MTTPDEDNEQQEVHEQFVECLYGLYGAEEADAQALVDQVLRDCGGDQAKAEEQLSEKFEQALQEIYDALDKVAPARMTVLLAYDLLCGGGEDDDSTDADDAEASDD